MTTESNELVVRQGNAAGLTIATSQGLEHAYRIANAMAQSGMFKDTGQAKQAFAKIVAGIEYGIGAYAAMSQIHVIDGKLSPGATLMAALIKRSGRYRFRQVESTDKVCRLEFLSRDDDGSWFSEGEVSFSIAEAETAGLTGKANWKRHPADMLFARALSRGARRFCADVFGGQSTYTPDELGDGESVYRRSELVMDDAAVDVDAVEESVADDVIDDTTDDAPADPLGSGVAARFPVTGSKGDVYTVTVYDDGGWECSCPARKDECKHVLAARRPHAGGGWLWPGMPGYEASPPAGATVHVDGTGGGAVTGDGVLLAFARELGVTDSEAMLVIARAGGPGDVEACKDALRDFAAERLAAAEETGEAA